MPPAKNDRSIDGPDSLVLLVSSSPHIHEPLDTKTIMRSVVLSLCPATLVGIAFFGIDALRVVLLSVGFCLLSEWLFLKAMRRPSTLSDWSAAVTGILLAMNLPSGSPWWLVLVGAFIAVVLAKQVYGGLGRNPFNPALVARVFLLVAFPAQMTTWVLPRGPWTPLDATTGATPLGVLEKAAGAGRTLAEADLTPLWKLFVGMHGGSLGEVSVVALLLGGGFLLFRGIIRWYIPISFIFVVFAVTGVAHWLAPERCASPFYHVLSGGLILGAFFMATDLVTSPVTLKGMLVFGVGCGLITSAIRLWGGYPEGVSFSILLMNGATPLIDRYTKPRVFGEPGRLDKEVVWS